MNSKSDQMLLPRDHHMNRQTARVSLIEYGDYECSFCRAVFPLVESMLGQFKGQLGFVFRHFPLTQIHPHAQLAAQAAEAAGRQGQFWEMHQQLFTSSDLTEMSLVRMATSLGLDLDKFAEDVVDEVLAEKIRSDFMSGVRLGLSGTPSFFINGLLFRGDWTRGKLNQAVEAKMGQEEDRASL